MHFFSWFELGQELPGLLADMPESGWWLGRAFMMIPCLFLCVTGFIKGFVLLLLMGIKASTSGSFRSKDMVLFSGLGFLGTCFFLRSLGQTRLAPDTILVLLKWKGLSPFDFLGNRDPTGSLGLVPWGATFLLTEGLILRTTESSSGSLALPWFTSLHRSLFSCCFTPSTGDGDLISLFMPRPLIPGDNVTCREDAVAESNGGVFPKHAKEVSKWIQAYDVTVKVGS